MNRLTVFGNKTSTIELIEFLIARGCPVDMVITLRPGASSAIISGRGDVASFCNKRQISYYETESYNLQSAADVKFFSSNGFDLGLCTGWQRLIPPAILDRFRSGVFGWHGSMFPFPNGRGRSPLNWSIRLGGERVFHNSFRYTPGADDGPVFDTRVIPIYGDYIEDLQAKALDHIKDTAVAIVQAHRSGQLARHLTLQAPGASVHFPKLGEEDGAIHLDRMSVAQIVDLVRSCSRPFPGAFLPDLRVWRSHAATATDEFEPGQVVSVDGHIRLRALDGDIVATVWEGNKPVVGNFLLHQKKAHLS